MPDKPRLTPEQIEKYAIRCALGNNGGKWATHYLEDQKQHWRNFVSDLSFDISVDVTEAAYERGLKDGSEV